MQRYAVFNTDTMPIKGKVGRKSTLTNNCMNLWTGLCLRVLYKVLFGRPDSVHFSPCYITRMFFFLTPPHCSRLPVDTRTISTKPVHSGGRHSNRAAASLPILCPSDSLSAWLQLLREEPTGILYASWDPLIEFPRRECGGMDIWMAVTWRLSNQKLAWWHCKQKVCM